MGMPLITDDTGFPIFNLFNTDNLLPSTVFIDHTMTIYYQEAGWNSSTATTKVNQMLDNCGSLCSQDPVLGCTDTGA